jgi:hypothetical protein
VTRLSIAVTTHCFLDNSNTYLISAAGAHQTTLDPMRHRL